MKHFLSIMLLCAIALPCFQTDTYADDDPRLFLDFLSSRCDSISLGVTLGSSKAATRKLLSNPGSVVRKSKDPKTDIFSYAEGEVMMVVGYDREKVNSVFMYVRYTNEDSTQAAVSALNKALAKSYGVADPNTGYYTQYCGEREYARKVGTTQLGEAVEDKYFTFALVKIR